jgi:hypothetical protein
MEDGVEIGDLVVDEVLSNVDISEDLKSAKCKYEKDDADHGYEMMYWYKTRSAAL